MATAKLRHIALTVPDIKREAAFFEQVFGFTKNSESDRAISLSDGVMNVTLLPYSPDRYVDKPQGTAVVGVDHIGFVIDDPKEYAAMDERIKAHIAKLGDLHPRITTCHVIVDEVDRHKEQGRLFEIHIDVKAPHAEIVATRQRHEDPYVALDDAFSVALRQLQDTRERQRGDVKAREAGRADKGTP